MFPFPFRSIEFSVEKATPIIPVICVKEVGERRVCGRRREGQIYEKKNEGSTVFFFLKTWLY